MTILDSGLLFWGHPAVYTPTQRLKHSTRAVKVGHNRAVGVTYLLVQEGSTVDLTWWQQMPYTH